MSDNIIQVNQEIIHTELKALVRTSVEEALNAMLDAEADRLSSMPIVMLGMRNVKPTDLVTMTIPLPLPPVR